MRHAAINDDRLVHALIDSIRHAADLGDHAARNDTGGLVALDLGHLHLGDEGGLVLLIPQQTRDIGHGHQLFRLEGNGDLCGGGVGVDNIDVKYAEANGITVKNTPKASSQSVAELAMGHMFSCARYLSIAGHTMREGKWEKKAYGKGIELQGKTLGIVGFGRIGQHLGVMAKAIGMTVIAFDIFHIPGIEEQLGIPYVEMDELLAKSDFISVHAPAVDGGALINAERIAKMKDGVCIINTSRGTNVDEAALLAALESGKVRAAGLDVYADEPASNSALYSHPMVSCTPHIGAATVEAQKRIGAEIVDIITNFGK